MKVSFGQTYNRYAYPSYKNATFNGELKRQSVESRIIGDLGLSIGVGVVTGLVAASVLSKRKTPNVLINSLGIGTVFSYITYIGTLLATPFRLK